MGIRVCKFGGSSLSNADQFRKVKDIVLSDPERRFVVPSAPGKRADEDMKITDLLYKCYKLAHTGQSYAECFSVIVERFCEIVSELGLDIDLLPLLHETEEEIARQPQPDYAASRGEYFSGIILANYLGWPFIDAAEVIRFDRTGAYASESTNEALREVLKDYDHAVIPGFYGSMPDGRIKTFSRGGSDISGAIVARAVKADMYENWTDVSGFLMADPHIIKDPKPIKTLTYRELRELSYMGATVLHEDAIFPVRKAGIPINIKNTNDPEHPGTIITVGDEDGQQNGTITGIAGHKNFTLLNIEKAMMNSELGFGRRVLGVLEELGISFEHLPTGIDTMSVVIADRELEMHRAEIMERIWERCQPDSIEFTSGVALIATVGRGMVNKRGTASRLFRALAVADVNVRMIDQGSSELNIIVGVDGKDFERAVSAIYYEFV
ncbi:MAG: aspartate kinase [Clostridia bacterium]|nr:aspartate kinase [Clostridia bacterium]